MEKCETRHDPRPKCPACGEIMVDAVWDFDWSHETVETECGYCEVPITINRYVEVSFTTKLR